MVIKAILFDLDGTLLNTLSDLANAVNRVLLNKGFPTHKIDAYRYFVGDGAEMLIKRALPNEKQEPETIRECLQAFQVQYEQNWANETIPYDGITEMLDGLHGRGLKLAVLSNKPHDATVRCITSLLPDWSFDIILGQREAVPRKPDPAGALEIADTLKISPSAFLYLGDTAIDMKTARAAGMFPVGALWGFRTAAELSENGAGALIIHPSEIFKLLS
ncbi:HAD family hydrolase [candidate division CSSED10-310 bacterium]|uniref:HAD family hydrolase n=1 Tax=candidate division CSSED10-310 bacterium TaxID=2855610 RepID=A0ABV6Z6S6_UNCC1